MTPRADEECSACIFAGLSGVPTNSWPLPHLDYYKFRRCVQALIEGVEGQAVWKDPNIVADLQCVIKQVSGLDVVLPK